MPRVLALALALSSSFAWGVADFVAGLKSRSLPVASVMLVAVVTGLALAGAVVVARGVAAPATSFLAYAALSAVAGSIGLAAFYRGLAVGAMSVVAPIAATGAAVPVAFGLASGERPGAVQVAGAAIAIVGVVLAAREEGSRSLTESGRSAGRTRLARGVPLALLAAVGLGSFLVAIDAASEGDVGWTILVNRLVSLGLLTFAAVVLRPRPPADLRDAAPAILVGVLETTANILIAIATTLGLVSLVGVLASLYPVVTIALARLVLGERIGRAQQLGAGTALAGVVLIAAG
ncbi:MAG: DMT family transporter [Thermoleophilaceae bacterium]|nr:DMT family transporter [Thermoleophilaceae bacterium]